MRKKKTKYRIRNWNEYSAGLVNRGRVTVWFDKEIIKQWLNQKKSGKRGASRKYTDLVIECMSVLKAVYHLPLRATEGFTLSIIEMLRLELPVPDFSTLSRRRKKLEVRLPQQHKEESIHMVVDSTGVKVYGEGEWKVRQHGWSKRRTWVKLHIGVDEKSKQIVAAVVSGNKVVDKEALPDLLSVTAVPIHQLSADGNYDYIDCYEEIDKYNARATIPPRRNAMIHPFVKRWHQRNVNIKRIVQIGRKAWKKEVGYHRRSLAETTMFRFKTIFGPKIYEKDFDAQACEILIRCAVLNKMAHLGMPISHAA